MVRASSRRDRSARPRRREASCSAPIEHVKDGPGEQRSAGFDPVIVEAAAVRIDDHVHDVLNVFGFVLGSEAHLFERVVLDARARRVGRIELRQRWPICFRQPAVSAQFSPLRS